MKKLVALIILMVVSLAAFTACVTPADKLAAKEGTAAANEYVYALYRDKNVKTPSDYSVVKQVPVNGVFYTVTWAVKVTSGDPEGVKVVVDEKGNYTIDVIDKALTDIEYTLTATVSDRIYGFTETTSFNFVVPEWKPMTYAEYVAAADADNVVVGGTITALLSKSLGDTTNGLYLDANDGNGGYYVYNYSTDPVGVLNVGDNVIITGEKDIYNGTLEIINCSIEVVSTGNAIVAKDVTEVYANAATLKDEALVYGQAQLVTIKGVTIGGVNASNGYYYFSLNGKESYVRISSSTCPLNAADTETFKAEHAAHTGWIANVTGVVCVYSGAFYLTPVTVDAFEYVSLPELSDAEAVAFEKANLNPGLDDLYAKAGTITLPAVGQAYDKVSVSWASNSEYAVVNGAKVAITLPAEQTEVTLTATFTAGEASDTQTYTFKVAPAKTITAVAPVAGTAYHFAMVQGNLNEVYYLTGAMDGYYAATTTDVNGAAKVYVEETTGGLHAYVLVGESKSYINMVVSGTYVNIKFEDAASTVYTYSETYNTIVATANDKEYYFGTRNDKTYTTMGPVEASKAPFCAQFVAINEGGSDTPDITDGPLVEGQAYNFGLINTLVSATDVYYIDGSMNGYYANTTTNAANAVEVYVEKVAGGYHLYAMVSGAKKYINMVASGTYVNFKYEDAASIVYTYSETLETLVGNVNGSDYVFGTRNDKTFTTVGCNAVSYDPFYCKFYPVENGGDVGGGDVGGGDTPDITDGPLVEGQAYNFGLINTLVSATDVYYIDGSMNGFYANTTTNAANAVEVYVEKVAGGYHLYAMVSGAKKYINMVASGTYVNFKYEDAASIVYTYSETLETLVGNVNGSDYVFGTRNDKTYTTVGCNAVSYDPFYCKFYPVENGGDTHECEFGAWQSNEEKHWKECACGEVAEEAAHDFTNGDCVCGKEAPEQGGDTPVVSGGSVDFNTIVTSNANGDSGYKNTYTTTSGWTVANSAIQTGGASVMNPQYPVIGADNTYKAVCLNGKVGAAGTLTSPTLTGGITTLKFSWTKMFTDTKIGVLVTITEIATGATQTYTLSWEGSKDEKYVINDVEWVLETVITGDFTIKFENTCPSANTGNKDRCTILSVEWIGAPTHVCEFSSKWTADETGHWHACECGETADFAEHEGTQYSNDGDVHSLECDDCGWMLVDGEDHDFTNGDCVCGAAAPAVNNVKTVAEFIEIAKTYAAGSYSTEKYEVTGVVTSVTNGTYGNLYIEDETGSVLIYGLYSADGKTRYDAMSIKPVKGDTITVLTVAGMYNTTPQGKDGWLIAHTAHDCVWSTNLVGDSKEHWLYCTICDAAGEKTEHDFTNGDCVCGEEKPAASQGGTDDFSTISATSTAYSSGKTTAGWAYANSAVFRGGSSNSSPNFSFISSSNAVKAICMNGKTSAKGTITSPTLTGGISKLVFNYGLPFGDTKIGFTVTITDLDTGATQTKTFSNNSASKYTAYEGIFELETPISGNFTIKFANNGPSNSSSNKDRTAIWNITWYK